MKTVEQITELIEFHQRRAEMKQKSLSDAMDRLQNSINRGREIFNYDLSYHLKDHSTKIECIKNEILEDMRAIELLEWVLAE